MTTDRDKPDECSSTADIFSQYGPFIRTVIATCVKDKAQVEDIFQDFYLHLVAKPIPPSVSNLEAYLFVIVRNFALDSVRKKKCYFDFLKKYSGRADKPAQRAPDYELALVDEVKRTFNLINRLLPKSQAKAIVKSCTTGIASEDLAREMGIKPRSLDRYFSAGLKKIEKALAADKDSLKK